jgi:threonine/homoserine/homoserine lactone efflux protein
MSFEIFLVYTMVAFFYIASPGPAVVLAIFNGIKTNMKVVAISSFANIVGLAILSTVSILGIGVILSTSALLFTVVKFIGASYLIYLGIKFLRNTNKMDFSAQDNITAKSNGQYFKESFLIAVSNPKPILFFTSIFPQFLDKTSNITPQFFMMTGIFMFISFFSLFFYGFLAKKSKVILSNEKSMTWFHRITGGIFITLGVGIMQLKSV